MGVEFALPDGCFPVGAFLAGCLITLSWSGAISLALPLLLLPEEYPLLPMDSQNNVPVDPNVLDIA